MKHVIISIIASCLLGITTHAERALQEQQAIEPKPIPEFAWKGLNWLVQAQHKNGGWGGGSHAAQQVRDPHRVQTDPATTSFAALALMRAGNTPTSGKFKSNVRAAAEHIIKVVAEAPAGPKITSLSGTQPQSKLGPYIDTAMATQFLSRLLNVLPKDDPLYVKVDGALDTCLGKLQQTQSKDGSWNSAGGWAPVLQSSASANALELAVVSGKKVDADVLDNARKSLTRDYDEKTGKAGGGAGAGVELYSFAGAQRANAVQARRVKDIVDKAKASGALPASAEIDAATVSQVVEDKEEAKELAQAWEQNKKQSERLVGSKSASADTQLIAGFGNNGGEEYLSFLMTSESLVISGGSEWSKWNDKMHGLLAKAQNPNGSWSGQHCITSPVFCTAAAVQCLTTDRDATLLAAVATATSKKAAK